MRAPGPDGAENIDLKKRAKKLIIIAKNRLIFDIIPAVDVSPFTISPLTIFVIEIFKTTKYGLAKSKRN